MNEHDMISNNSNIELEESNNVTSDKEHISLFLNSVDDKSQFIVARLAKSVKTTCYLNTAKFSDGSPVLKYFYRGKFTTLYDHTVGRGRWIILDSDACGYVYDKQHDGWLQFQLYPGEHRDCFSVDVLHSLAYLTDDDYWRETTVNESTGEYDYQERDTYIPAPFDKYYEIGMLNDGSISEEDIPDAFDNYGGMTLLAVVYAKEQYEDALGDNCLDYCYLVEDGNKFALVTTAGQRVYYVDIAEVERCVNRDVDEDFDVREPSSVDYGNAISSYYKELTDTIEKYGIRKIGRKRSIEYDGVVNGHKFFFVEGNTGTGHYAKELYIDGKEVNLYQSKESKRSFAYLNEMNQFGILSLVKMLETDNFSGIVYRDVDTLDDYEESLVEDVEMSDAQRLALQELDSCLEYGELNAEQHELAYKIQWDINFEDVLLFVNGIDIPLQDIKHVEYGDCSNEYDGCYNVTLHDGTTKHYGWHDWDATASLTCIDCNESLTDSCLHESITDFKDLYTYKYQFQVIGKSEPNRTYGDDMLRHAEEFGCVKIYYPLDLPTRQTRFLYICKDADAYNAYQEFLNNDGILKHLYWLSPLKPFDASEVEDNLRSIYKKELDRLEAQTTGSRRRGRPSKPRFKEPSVAFYVDDYNKGDIRIPLTDILTESTVRRFNKGDRVYVTVNNRQGNVTKMVSSDVVEVEFEANGTYPARIDRYYVDEVELIFTDDEDGEDNLTPIEIKHPEDIDNYLRDPNGKFIPDDDF